MEIYLKEAKLISLPEVLIIHNIKEPLKRLIKVFKSFDIIYGSSRQIFCWIDSINDSRIYYNGIRHTTTQIRQFKLLTNMNDENFFKKAKDNKLKLEQKLN